jgi:hypothetical protein
MTRNGITEEVDGESSGQFNRQTVDLRPTPTDANPQRVHQRGDQPPSPESFDDEEDDYAVNPHLTMAISAANRPGMGENSRATDGPAAHSNVNQRSQRTDRERDRAEYLQQLYAEQQQRLINKSDSRGRGSNDQLNDFDQEGEYRLENEGNHSQQARLRETLDFFQQFDERQQQLREDINRETQRQRQVINEERQRVFRGNRREEQERQQAFNRNITNDAVDEEYRRMRTDFENGLYDDPYQWDEEYQRPAHLHNPRPNDESEVRNSYYRSPQRIPDVTRSSQNYTNPPIRQAPNPPLPRNHRIEQPGHRPSVIRRVPANRMNPPLNPSINPSSNSSTRDILESIRLLAEGMSGGLSTLRHRPTLDKQKPPKFNGNKAAAEDFWKDYNRVADTNQWTESYRAKVLIHYLTDKAKNWFEGMGLEGSPWDVISEAFRATYLPNEAKYEAIRLYNAATQRYGETPTEFLYRVLKLKSNTGEIMPEESVVSVIRRGLSNKGCRLALGNAKTLDEAIERVEMFEDIIVVDGRDYRSGQRESEGNLTTNRRQDFRDYRPSRSEPTPDSRNDYAIPDLRTERQQVEVERGFQPICYNCDQRGHLSRQCPEEANPERIRQKAEEWEAKRRRSLQKPSVEEQMNAITRNLNQLNLQNNTEVKTIKTSQTNPQSSKTFIPYPRVT